MISDEEGFWYPQVDKDNCIKCGLCEKVCPILHKWQSDENRTTTAMAAINLNEDIRLNSSSGGIFTLIAEEIINHGGVVFGAAFAQDFKSVHHICVDNISELEKLRGSKYVQSKIGNTYKQAKDYLDKGRTVLFTGTPCQIGGLYSYLSKPYDNLFTQDIICHGVPSPTVWEKYVDEREKRAMSNTKRIVFRNKKYGWKNYSVSFDFSNNTEYIVKHHKDSFMKIFLYNVCLRPSCYACSFKRIKRQADITLGDFWGVQQVKNSMDDDKGTSIVLVHSDKGSLLLSTILMSIKYEETKLEHIKKYNPALVESAHNVACRNSFIREFRKTDIKTLAKKYCKTSVKNRIIIFLSRRKSFASLLKKLNRGHN